MDEFDRARLRTERMREKGRFVPQEHLDKGDRLIQELEAKSPVVHERKEANPVPALLKPKEKSGKVPIEVRIYLNDEPMVFRFNTEMRTHVLPSQLKRDWLTRKLQDMLREFGRVHDVSSSGK